MNSAKKNKRTLLNHFQAILAFVENLNLEVFLDCKTFQLYFKQEESFTTWQPQFLEYVENQKLLTQKFSDRAQVFTGWRPYEFKTLRKFSDKLKFKNYLTEHGFKVPTFSKDRTNIGPVILKNKDGSFAKDINGPYQKSSMCPLQLKMGDYFEAFILGEIVKIWFWNHQPICMELQKMPSVKGDGKRSIRQLLEERCKILGSFLDGPAINEILQFSELTSESILQKNQSALVDFRYASPLSLPSDTKMIEFSNTKAPSLYPKLLKLGALLYTNLIHESCGALLYTIDAILVDKQKLFILEGNTNPFVHPLCYKAMLTNTILGK